MTVLVKAQVRCGTVEYTKLLRDTRNVLESREQFEQWMERKRVDRIRRSGSERTQAVLQIPVVIHVIHNGEAIGTGKNIPDAQILSQIAVLNKDYTRLNADAASTPPEFVPLAGAFDVEFVLAKQDPEGVATTGINRVKGTKSSWSMNDNYQLKALSYWPAEDYLNIWVCNLTDFLGYSQFPVSALPGLENASTNRLTDGVVIAYNAFGSIDDGPFALQTNYNRGRTATHEIGHFFGLNHIWGDDDNACTGTDNVDDTPNQAGETGGCPTHPRVTCDVVSMFQNYLDYTNDVCMNLFTHGQVDRMQTVIDNSPRRASLPSSHGLLLPLPVVNDLGIKSILRPAEGECSGNFDPIVEVRNYGSNVINTAKIRLTKDGAVIETKDVVFSPALSLLEFTSVSFSSLNFSSGPHNVKFEILLTNGTSDGQTSNNTSTQNVETPENISLPFIETFNTLPPGWEILNPDQNIKWQLAATGNGSNSSLKVALYNYEDHIGEIDAVITPVFDLSTAPAALLKFDVAYAQFQSSSDGLKVILLANCNTDIEDGTEVYNKFGSALASTTATSDEFTPESPSDWRTEIIDLTLYAGQGNFQLAFVSYNDWGNNIFLDNIGLTTSPIHDIVLTDIVAPSPVTCENKPNLQLKIRNAGTLISSLKVIATVNGTENVQTVSNLNFPGNTTMSVLLDPLDLSEGANDISIEITEPDGELDFSPDDNTLALKTVVNSASDAIPIKENFEGSYDQWTITNPHDGMNWEESQVNSNTALYANGFDNSTSGDQSWLVSPSLDFSSVEGASLFFDQSYAYAEGTSDVLFILASFNCGSTFSDTLYTSAGIGLANGKLSESSWKPAGEDDWVRKSLALPSLVGHSDVRLAFVFFNDNGNNLYLDNIEFFTSNDPLRIDEDFSVYPNPITTGTARITFNLPMKSAIEVDLIDALGKVLTTEKLTGVLNQTYSFDIPGSASGTYFVRIITDDKTYYRKIMLIR